MDGYLAVHDIGASAPDLLNQDYASKSCGHLLLDFLFSYFTCFRFSLYNIKKQPRWRQLAFYEAGAQIPMLQLKFSCSQPLHNKHTFAPTALLHTIQMIPCIADVLCGRFILPN